MASYTNDDYSDWGYDAGGGSALTNVGTSMGSDWDEYGNYTGGEPGGPTGYTESTGDWDEYGNYRGGEPGGPTGYENTTGTTTTGTTATGTKVATTGTGKTGDGKEVDWGSALNKVLSTGGGLFDLFNKSSSLGMRQITDRSVDLADPLHKDRGYYGGMLKGLMTDPMSYNLSAPAQFELAQGTENLSRAGAARGLLGSGNLMGEIMKYGQGVASQDYWKQVENLGRLSGGYTGDMSGAGKLYSGIYNMRNNAAANIGGGTSGGRTTSTTPTTTGGTTGGTTSGGSGTNGSTAGKVSEWGNVFNAGKSIVTSIGDWFK